MDEVICGLDEAGRGPLAGPVTAGCVVLPADFPRALLGDSKALTLRQRERAFEALQRDAWWGLGWASAEEIDTWNILQASLLAMRRAYDDLRQRFPDVVPRSAIVDGLHAPALPILVTPMVKADATVAEVSAASILAKVARDRFMLEAHAADPRYGFAVHKGYPTAAHRQALALYGPGPLHRRSFRGAQDRPQA